MQSIVVIEDNDEVRENLIETLELGDYAVTGAADGHEGVRLVREVMPQLILCDVVMPKLDGYGVLELLRADAATAAIPFVFLTAKAEREDLRRGMNLGASDYVTKPFFQDELLRVVELRIREAAAAAASRAEPTRRDAAELLGELLGAARERSFADRQTIYFEGDPVQSVYCVRGGRVRIHKETAFGKSLTYDSAGVGAWFGWDEFVAGDVRRATASAYPTATVAIVDKAEVAAVLRRYPELYRWVANHLAQDLALRADQLVQIAYFSVRKRVAEFLLRATRGESGEHVDLRREDIAEYVATTPESVTRTMTEFRREGLVTLPAEGGVIVADVAGLSAVPA